MQAPKEGVSTMNFQSNWKYYGRRLLAYAIDWYVGGLLISLPITLRAMKIDPTATLVSQNLDQFPIPLSLIIGVICVIVGFIYYVIVPNSIWEGQTLGKKLTKLKIVSTDGAKVTFKQMFMRQFVGIILIEGSFYNVSNFIHQILTIVSGINFSKYLGSVGLLITAASLLYSVFNEKNQTFHDVLSKTKVEANA